MNGMATVARTRSALGSLSVVLLAAGKSTRIAAISGGKPKPLIPVHGQPVLLRNLRWLANQGVQSVWINLHYRPGEIRDAIGDGRIAGIRANFSYEDEILGTAGAVKKLQHVLGERILVVYGDNLLSLDLLAMHQAHLAEKAEVTVALFDWHRHFHSGIAGGRVALSADGAITSFQEGAAGGSISGDLVNAGVYLLESTVLNKLVPGRFADFGRDVFPRLISKRKRIFGWVIGPGGYCLALDTPESFARSMQLVDSGQISLS